MTLQEFIDKWNGKKCDFDGFYGGQCVDLYRMYVKEVLQLPQSPSVAGAKDIWNSYLTKYYDRIPNTPDGIPEPGDIMIWGDKYGQWGHVAIVTKATLTTFTCFSQNDPPGALCGTKTYRTYIPTLGWLHPKGVNISDTTEIDQLKKKVADLTLEIERKNEQIGNYVNQVAGLAKDIENLKIELAEEEKARNDNLIKIADKLSCANDIVTILKEIEKLIVAEEGLQTCIDAKRVCENNVALKSTELAQVYENIKLLSGYSIASPSGVERAMQSYNNLHKIRVVGDIQQFTYILKIGGLIWKK